MRFILLATAAMLALGAEKGPPRGEASNKALKIEATAWLDKASIDNAVGQPMTEGVVVVEVKLTPAASQTIAVDFNDFLLRSDKDGQRTTPYSASQVAGNSVLVISSRAVDGGAVATENRGPSWGGLGGGMPQRLPGQSPGVGNTAVVTEANAEMRGGETPANKDNPLLAAVKAKILPEKEIREPLAGQLYFLLEGKHKTKQIELIYKSSAGPLSIRFKE